jgi:hypothetical protein
MLNQLLCVALPTRTWFAAQVHEVVGVIVTLAEHFVLGVVEKREELVIESSFPFGR